MVKGRGLVVLVLVNYKYCIHDIILPPSVSDQPHHTLIPPPPPKAMGEGTAHRRTLPVALGGWRIGCPGYGRGGKSGKGREESIKKKSNDE